MDILNNRYKAAYERSNPSESKDRELHRFLFLDIDGVLNTIRYSDYLIDHDEDEFDEYGALFDSEAVANLTYIIEKLPDVKIIISSTWRFKGWEWMNRLWVMRQLPGSIFSFTPVLEEVCFVDKVNRTNSSSVYPIGTRGLEINEWLRTHASLNSFSYKYIILDDEKDLLLEQQDNLILTDPYYGITKKDVLKALEMLL